MERNSFQVSIDRSKHMPGWMLEKIIPVFAVPYFFEMCLYQVLPQKPANISPTVGTLGQLGRNPYLGHFQVTTVYIFPFFTSFPQKKQIKSKSSRKKSTLQSSIFAQPKKKTTNDPLGRGELIFPGFSFPPRTSPSTVTVSHPSTWEAEPPHQGRYFRQAGIPRRDADRESDGDFRQWSLSPKLFLFASKKNHGF